jgi:hypothetical protein
MFKALYEGVFLALLCTTLIWVAYTETTRSTQLAEIRNAQQQVEREMERVEAVRTAQEQAKPILRLAEQLARENAMFNSVVEKARQIVVKKADELEQTKEALSHSVELLKEQIEENNRCVDHIRKLEGFIRELMEKIPEGERPEPPKIEDRGDGKLPPGPKTLTIEEFNYGS